MIEGKLQESEKLREELGVFVKEDKKYIQEMKDKIV